MFGFSITKQLWDKLYNLQYKIFELNEKKHKILYIPPGFANGFKFIENNSQILIFSDKTLAESQKDDYRYDKNMWINWESI